MEVIVIKLIDPSLPDNILHVHTYRYTATSVLCVYMHVCVCMYACTCVHMALLQVYHNNLFGQILTFDRKLMANGHLLFQDLI